MKITRALISVSDKKGVAAFARALEKQGVDIISTGGTSELLRKEGVPVRDISSFTDFPEVLEGRVKTLHPRVHGGLLYKRGNELHEKQAKEQGFQPIDLVVVNLYPFEQTIQKPDVTLAEAIEQIDIGGPSMIRSAAKNHRSVLVLTNSDRYLKTLGDLREHNGSTCAKHRLKQAQRAFAHTAEYDSLIANYLASAAGVDSGGMVLNLHKALDLRYGENPHQKATLLV